MNLIGIWIVDHHGLDKYPSEVCIFGAAAGALQALWAALGWSLELEPITGPFPFPGGVKSLKFFLGFGSECRNVGFICSFLSILSPKS